MSDNGSTPMREMPDSVSAVVRQHDTRLDNLERALTAVVSGQQRNWDLLLDMNQKIGESTATLKRVEEKMGEHVAMSQTRAAAVNSEVASVSKEVRALQDERLVRSGKTETVNVFMRGYGTPIIRTALLLLLGGGVLWFVNARVESVMDRLRQVAPRTGP